MALEGEGGSDLTCSQLARVSRWSGNKGLTVKSRWRCCGISCRLSEGAATGENWRTRCEETCSRTGGEALEGFHYSQHGWLVLSHLCRKYLSVPIGYKVTTRWFRDGNQNALESTMQGLGFEENVTLSWTHVNQSRLNHKHNWTKIRGKQGCHSAGNGTTWPPGELPGESKQTRWVQMFSRWAKTLANYPPPQAKSESRSTQTPAGTENRRHNRSGPNQEKLGLQWG